MNEVQGEAYKGGQRPVPITGMERGSPDHTIREIYKLLWEAYGPQHWWPAETPTEVVIGAVLTQNTAWANVERAIERLRAADCLSWAALRDVSIERLADLIRPSGTFRVKAVRLKAVVNHLWERHGGDLDSMLGGDLATARRDLLEVSGIGPETADAILLYAGHQPTFVVDAYTKRILRRHFVIDGSTTYQDVRALFHRAITADVEQFNEYHALLVAVGKRHCRAQADCAGCPLESMSHDGAM